MNKRVLSIILFFIGLLLLTMCLFFAEEVQAGTKQPTVEIIREIDIIIDERIKLPSITVNNEVLNASSKEIDINIGEPVVKTIEIKPLEEIQRNKEIDLVARLIEAEAGLDSIPFGEKVCVGLTVLHRVDDTAFPNNVTSNVYIGSQYTVPAEIASETSRRAAEYAFQLWENGESYNYLPSEALYFKGDGEHNHFHNRDGERYEDLDILTQDDPYQEILDLDEPEKDILLDIVPEEKDILDM